MLDVCLLGTGGMMPLPNRWLSSLLIKCQGRMLLIDCGEGTQIPFKMTAWGLKTLDTILFTHYHADHIAGLPGLLLTLANSGREEPLLLLGPPGIQEIVKGLTVISPDLPYELRLIELSKSNCTQSGIKDLIIKSIPVEHSLPCLAYCLELRRQGKFDVQRAKQLNIPRDLWHKLQKGETLTIGGQTITPPMVLGEERKGLKVCYCTDTRPTEGLSKFIEGSDLFVSEGMYGDENDLCKAQQKKHMLFSEAARLAKYGKVKELWLTHYSPSLTEPELYLQNAKTIFSNTIAGKDLLSKSLKFINQTL